jgi:hypothetical protein
LKSKPKTEGRRRRGLERKAKKLRLEKKAKSLGQEGLEKKVTNGMLKRMSIGIIITADSVNNLRARMRSHNPKKNASRAPETGERS